MHIEKRLVAICLLLVVGLFAIAASDVHAQQRAPGSTGQAYKCTNCKNSHVGELPKCPKCGYILIYLTEEVDEKELKKKMELKAKFRKFMGYGIVIVIKLILIFIISLIVFMLRGAAESRREQREIEESARQSALQNPGPAKIAASPFASRKPAEE